MDEAPTSRRRIRQLEVVVAEAVYETPDTTTLVLQAGDDHLDYKPGQFLTIDPHQFEALERFTAFLEDLKGRREPPRAYSMASAPHEKHLAFTVKEERYASGTTKYPPLLSPLLVKRAPPGMRFVVSGFTGPYTLPEDVESKTDHVVHLCAGSGSVPNFSILKHALLFHPRIRHTFIYSNKTWDDVIFRRELTTLEEQHPERLRVVHTLTRETRPGVRTGRVTTELIRELVPDVPGAIFFACGPAISAWDKLAARNGGPPPTPRFLETVLASLKELEVPPPRITRESYG